MPPWALAAAAGVQEGIGVLRLTLPHTTGLLPQCPHLRRWGDGPCSAELFRIKHGSQQQGGKRETVSRWLGLTQEEESTILVTGLDESK